MKNYLFDLGHPAHFHLFKNFIDYIISKGSDVILVLRHKDVLIELVKKSNYPYVIPYGSDIIKRNRLSYFIEFTLRSFSILRYCFHYKINIILTSSITSAIAALILRKKLYAFGEDDKNVRMDKGLLFKIAARKIIVPTALKDNFGSKTLKYPSYHELAYLHPDNFIPNRNILRKYNLKPKEYIVVRFSALKAHHDVNASGISANLWRKIEDLIGKYQIIKSVEDEKSHQIEPWDMHHILAFSKMIISDSQTMTVEGSVLGVPSIRINTFVGKSTLIAELEDKYKLAIGILPHDEDLILETIQSILDDPETDRIWAQRRVNLLTEKSDLNQWMIDFFESLE